jgi:hypothetical protein
MMKIGDAYTLERERVLAEGLDRVAAELRLVDPQDYVAFIRTELFGNIANIVNSSTELYYQPGALKFGMSGEADLSWGEPAQVTLDMEFEHMDVKAYFRLVLAGEQAGVELTYLAFGAASPDPKHNTQRLREALAAARVVDGRRFSRLAELATAEREPVG